MEQRTRIVHVLGQLAAGGAERFVVDLACEMRRDGQDVELACLVPQRDAVGLVQEARLRAAGVPIHSGPGASLRPNTVRWLAKLLSAPDISLVHIHLHYSEIAFAAARFLHRRRYAAVRTLHNTVAATQGARRAAEHWALRSSGIRHSISCGEACQEAYEGRLAGDLTCIPYGIHFDWRRHSPIQRDERQAVLGLDPERTHYMAVGSQIGDSPGTAQKGHDILIQAWRDGQLSRHGGELHLLGDGPLRAKLEALAGGDASISFHGIRPDVQDWLSAADTYVMPSRFEGLPLAGIEAVGTGIPAILSDIAPLRELGSTSALYFPPDDAGALAQLLLDRLGKRDSASEAELHAVRARHGIARATRGYLEVYSRIRGEQAVRSLLTPEAEGHALSVAAETSHGSRPGAGAQSRGAASAATA